MLEVASSVSFVSNAAIKPSSRLPMSAAVYRPEANVKATRTLISDCVTRDICRRNQDVAEPRAWSILWGLEICS